MTWPRGALHLEITHILSQSKITASLAPVTPRHIALPATPKVVAEYCVLLRVAARHPSALLRDDAPRSRKHTLECHTRRRDRQQASGSQSNVRESLLMQGPAGNCSGLRFRCNGASHVRRPLGLQCQGMTRGHSPRPSLSPRPLIHPRCKGPQTSQKRARMIGWRLVGTIR